MKKWMSRGGALLFVLFIIGFGIPSSKRCPDGSRVDTYLAVTVYAALTSNDLCNSDSN